MPLVNHHQPEQALRAQQMLRLLEEVRDTLLDPARRQAYDAQLGTVGGVIDPTATPTTATSPGVMPPPPPPDRRSTGGDRDKPQSLWECRRCKTENPPFKEFCLNCGQRLIEVCPVCEQEEFVVSTQRCGNCNRSARECQEWLATMTQLETVARSAGEQLRQAESEVQETGNRIASIMGTIRERSGSKSGCLGWWFALLLFETGLLMFGIGPLFEQSTLLAPLLIISSIAIVVRKIAKRTGRAYSVTPLQQELQTVKSRYSMLCQNREVRLATYNEACRNLLSHLYTRCPSQMDSNIAANITMLGQSEDDYAVRILAEWQRRIAV